jgi:hypothetical protein
MADKDIDDQVLAAIKVTAQNKETMHPDALMTNQKQL